MPSPVSVGAALIVRDEASVLRRCLESLAGAVDEIVVVDTGSTDPSPEVAEELGARVLHRPWDHDFSVARNLGLDHLSADWVLYIDADEYLVDHGAGRMADGLLDPDRHVAYRVRMRSHARYTRYLEYRIWRNRPDIRFRGVIHETTVPDIWRVAGDEGLLVGDTAICLDHDGYEGDQEAKHRRNLPMLLAAVGQDPDRTYLWDHIGRIHAARGDAASAQEAWRHGIELVRKNGVTVPVDSQVYVDMIFSNARLETPDADLLAEALTLFPDNPYVLWCGALDAMARHAFVQARDLLDRVVDLPEDVAADCGLAGDERLTREWTFNARGVCRYQLGDLAGAAADFGRAEALAPDVAEYRARRALVEARLHPPR